MGLKTFPGTSFSRNVFVYDCLLGIFVDALIARCLSIL